MDRLPVSTGRIQRNRRPAYSYVDPSSLAPLPDPVHDCARAQNVERSHNNGEVPVVEQPPRTYIKEEITAENVHLVPTLQLLRCRARAVRAMYRRMYRVLYKKQTETFVFVSPEQEGTSTLERERALREYITKHIPVIELYRRRIESNIHAKRRFKLANRGRGRQKEWDRRNEAAVAELDKRDSQVANPVVTAPTAVSAGNESARAHQVADARASSTPSDIAASSAGGAGGSSSGGRLSSSSAGGASTTANRLYPGQYTVDVNNIELQMRMEELGLPPLTVKDKVKSAYVTAIQRGDTEAALQHKRRLDSMNEHERRRSSAKKARKRIIAAERQAKNRSYYQKDPNSGDEAGAGGF